MSGGKLEGRTVFPQEKHQATVQIASSDKNSVIYIQIRIAVQVKQAWWNHAFEILESDDLIIQGAITTLDEFHDQLVQLCFFQ
ncbi:hypothetical protein D3C81_1179740 [compost metagenome]